jgi:hypothetical protein
MEESKNSYIRAAGSFTDSDRERSNGLSYFSHPRTAVDQRGCCFYRRSCGEVRGATICMRFDFVT